ncbi:MAG: hypothetical protein QOF51_20 [Chloroflexota bacterium]|nr:hypothetical protein [Chloroflexota bacterium]
MVAILVPVALNVFPCVDLRCLNRVGYLYLVLASGLLASIGLAIAALRGEDGDHGVAGVAILADVAMAVWFTMTLGRSALP